MPCCFVALSEASSSSSSSGSVGSFGLFLSFAFCLLVWFHRRDLGFFCFCTLLCKQEQVCREMVLARRFHLLWKKGEEGKTLRSGNKSGEALEPSCGYGSCKKATKPCLLQSCGCCKLHHESICCAEFGACIMAFFYELRHDECKEERRLGGGFSLPAEFRVWECFSIFVFCMYLFLINASAVRILYGHCKG